MALKESIKAFLLLAVAGDQSHSARQKKLSGKTTREVFETIYRERMWGGRFSRHRFYSGAGSRDERVVGPYIAAVRTYLTARANAPAIVDIGCGDFSVGCRLVDLASRYVACDVVQPLIEEHRKRFFMSNVEFKVVDAIEDSLPAGDVALIRQVFQHLSNDQVAAVLPRLNQYRTAIITEHVPTGSDFVPNLDVSAGLDTRLRLNSGLVVTAPPFNMSVKTSRVICEVPWDGGVIRTVAYEL
jgi:hypothetical protein